MFRCIVRVLFAYCVTMIVSQEEVVGQPPATYDPDIYFLCRVQINGQWVNDIVTIPLDTPNNPPTGNGSALYYPVGASNRDPAQVNCHNQQYAYLVVSINANWSFQKVVNGQVVVFNKTNNKAYWDWHYEGYTPPMENDYARNCHGFTFGKGVWVEDASKLVNFGQLPTACYIPALVNDATIATDVRAADKHSMKVTGILCDHPTIPQIKVPKYKTSQEQYRESGTYSQDQGCPNGINILKAHTAAKAGWAYPPPHQYTPPALEAFKPK